MKKYGSLFLVALMLCGCLSLFLVTPVSAAERSVIEYDYSGGISGWYRFEGKERTGGHSVTFDGVCMFPFVPSDAVFDSVNNCQPVYQGDISFDFAYGTQFYFLRFESGFIEEYDSFSWGAWYDGCSFYSDVLPIGDDFFIIPSGSYLYFAPGSTITVEWSEMRLVPVDPDQEGAGGIYGSIEALISDAFYGQGAILTGWQQLVVTLLATFAVVFMFALPFLLIVFLIKLIGGCR